MIDTLFELVGMNLNDFNLDHNIVFICLTLIIFYCLGYVFNFIQTAMERLTAKKR